MNKRFTSTIGGATIFITLFSLLSRGLGVLREMIYASYFGLSTEFDLYLIGTVLPTSINTIIIYIGQNYFIPNYNRIKKLSLPDSHEFIRFSLLVFLGLSIILTIFLYFLSESFVSFYMGNNSGNTSLALQIFRIFIITIPINALNSILSAYLQAEFEFRYPAAAQLFLNISVIFIVLLSSSYYGIFSIAFGYIAGLLSQLVFLLFKCPVKKWFSGTFRMLNMSLLLNTSGTLMVIIVVETLSQLYSIIDRYFYSSVDKGGLAALNYSTTLFTLPISVISVALSTVMFSNISKLVSEKQEVLLDQHFRNFIRINLMIFVPISIVYFFWGDSIIHILFERGKFTNADTKMTQTILRIFSLSLIFYSSYAVINKIFYSANFIKYLLIITTYGLIIKSVLNLLLVGSLQQDGLALSTTISYTTFFFIGLVFITKKMNLRSNFFFLTELFFVLCNGFLSVFITSMIFDNHSIFLSTVQIVVFLSIFSINLIIIKPKSYDLLKNTIRNFRISLMN